MLESEADVWFIRQVLGHARLETTALSASVSVRKLKEIRQATHPGARLPGWAAANEGDGER